MQRAYSVLEVKSVSADERVIRGIATTPRVDRMGDIVDPLGVQVARDIPLFLYHDSKLVVGRATFGKATAQGIPFDARLPHISEPGTLKDRVDEAWGMVKHGLITGVSIGFSVVEGAVERMKSGGMKFLKTEVMELSLVPIPAQPEALIQGWKSMDAPARQDALIQQIKTADLATQAASGPREKRPPPGVSGNPKQPASSGFFYARNTKGHPMQTIKELSELRQTKAARMHELLELASAESRENSDDEAQEFDALDLEVKDVDAQLRRMRLDAIRAASATPVEGRSAATASRSRGPAIIVNKSPDDAFKGQSFTRKVIAKALAHLNQCSPVDIAKARWGRTNPQLVEIIKADVPGGGTGAGEWGSELVGIDGRYTGDFLEYLQGMTVFDRLPLRNVPANVQIKGQDGAATAYWVGESKAIPATTADFSAVTLSPLKVAALAVVSNELLRDSSPSAEMLVRDALVQASAQRVDATFLSAAAGVAGVSPAGILNGLTAVTSLGTSADDLRGDVAALMASFIAAKNVSGLYFVTTPSLGLQIQLMRNTLGQREFDGLTLNGGTLEGIPAVVGDNVGTGDLILLKPSDIYRIGDTGVQVSISRDAMIEQSDAPTGATDTPVAASAKFTSMFQEESTAIKIVRPINFAKRRASAVAYVGDANYGGVATP